MSGFHAFTLEFGDDPGNGISGHAVRNRLMPMLHYAFRVVPGVFALGVMVERAGVRVFAQDAHAELLQGLASELRTRPLIRDYGTCSAVAPVTAPTAWVAFRRYRLPTERSDRNAGAEGSALRARRLAEAQRRRLPFFDVTSSSTGARFKLTVAPELRSAGDRGVFAPDGYGLASATRDFAVPIDGPATLFCRRAPTD